LETFLKEVEEGPSGAKVHKIDREDREVKSGEKGFDVVD